MPKEKNIYKERNARRKRNIKSAMPEEKKQNF